jgi:hypothetical protein
MFICVCHRHLSTTPGIHTHTQIQEIQQNLESKQTELKKEITVILAASNEALETRSSDTLSGNEKSLSTTSKSKVKTQVKKSAVVQTFEAKELVDIKASCQTFKVNNMLLKREMRHDMDDMHRIKWLCSSPPLKASIAS